MINLFINRYTDTNPKRQAELDFCYETNKANPQIDNVYEITGDRPTFREIFQLVNLTCKPEDITIIANADIYFKDLSLITENIKENQAWCLGRWEIFPNGVEAPFGRNDSMDTWVFKGKIKEVPDCDFLIGKIGSDNAIAERLQRAGYIVKNPSISVRTYHKHETNYRNHNINDIVHKPYLLITPHEIDSPAVHTIRKEPITIITSLSPNHNNADNQLQALETWKRYGKCYSLNIASEIEVLKPLYEGITFIETDRTVKELFGKNLVSINALLDFGKQCNQDVILLNSDIIIRTLPDFKQDGITILSRWDYSDNIEQSELFPHGFDLMFIPKQFLHIFPPMSYGLGCCFWDVSLPYRAIKKGIPVYHPKDKFIFHKKHTVQYSYSEWLKTGRFFKFEYDIDEHIPVPQVVNSVMFTINQKTIKY